MKKIILSFTVLFLLFEVMYFDSNNKIQNVKNNAKKVVYDIEIDEDRKQDFIKNYGNIILENDGYKVKVLTDKEVVSEIKNKYNFKYDK